MSPIRPFTTARVGVTEVNVWRYGMAHPSVGDILERGSDTVRVTRVMFRPCSDRDVAAFDARPDLGDYMLILEYEPLP